MWHRDGAGGQEFNETCQEDIVCSGSPLEVKILIDTGRGEEGREERGSGDVGEQMPKQTGAVGWLQRVFVTILNTKEG